MECSGGLGVLGEDRTAASRRWRSAAADDEDDDDGDVARLPEGRGSVGRKRGSRRSS